MFSKHAEVYEGLQKRSKMEPSLYYVVILWKGPKNLIIIRFDLFKNEECVNSEALNKLVVFALN